jgi:ParB family transcriptional regulator, chromosome partitioning protein
MDLKRLKILNQSQTSTMNKKKELGKGLRALLTNIEQTKNVEVKKEIVKELNTNTANVSIEDIEANPYQPRVEFDNDLLMDLARSIKVHGLIQPITLRSLGGNKYQIISGERRFRASKMAGLKEVPAYVRTANDQEMLEMALIENIQRADLNAIEIAISYQRLIDECNLTHESLSDRVGKNRSTVTNYIRLLKLNPEIQTAIKAGTISMGHARALVGVEDLLKQMYAYKKVVSESLSVRQLEQLLKEEIKSSTSEVSSANTQNVNPEITRITKELSKILGAKVTIKRDQKGKGSFTLPFSNDKEFNSIYDLLKELE